MDLIDDLASPTTAKANLRTCGRWIGEKQAPPRVVKRTESVPSIPSRFETTIHKGYREVLGFGSKDLRWDGKKDAPLPGPGQYAEPKSSITEFLERPGFGIRGTGGFASRSVRLGARSVPALPRYGRGVPGPGKYEEMAALSAARNGKDFNQAGKTAVFAQKSEKHVCHPMPLVPPQPGPGHYTAKVLPKEAAAAQASFNSRSTRLGAKPAAAEFPGPGEYFDGAKTAIVAAEVSAEPRDAVFKAPSRPRIVSVHRDLPTANESGREVLGKFADEVSQVCLGTQGLALRQPGPGAYEIDRDSMWEGRLVGVKGSSSFQVGPSRKDFVSEEARLVPGPGIYEPKKVITDRFTSAESVFNSESARCKYTHPEAPGPAYYTVKLPSDRKSFRLKTDEIFQA